MFLYLAGHFYTFSSCLDCCVWSGLCILVVCGSFLLWRFLPGGGVGQLACQGFLVREAWVGVLLCGTGFVLSGVQWSVQ